MNPSLTTDIKEMFKPYLVHTALVFAYTLHILSINRMEVEKLMDFVYFEIMCSLFLFLNLPVEADCLPLLLREVVLVHCRRYLALNGGVDNPFSTK